jgi:hypothetical protein
MDAAICRQALWRPEPAVARPLYLLDTRSIQFVSRPYAAKPISGVPGNRCAMSDIIFTVLALALFIASVGYAYACERL